MKNKEERDKRAVDAYIQTEGKTDWKHLKHAMRKLNVSLNLEYCEEEGCFGDTKLLDECKALTRSPQPREIPVIFLFDHDNPAVSKEAERKGHEFKDWENNIFSLLIPIPKHRTGHKSISIEFYYSDAEIMTQDANGRRLFLSSEFNEGSGKLKSDTSVHYGTRHALKGKTDFRSSKVLEAEVFNEHNENIALSKSNFADYIFDETPPFGSFDCGHFSEIFAVIQKIVELSKERQRPVQRPSARVVRDYPPVVNIFVGREDYLNRFKDPNVRVIAITGLGGEGKSTLAARAYEISQSDEPGLSAERFAWCDCKDMETPLHDKLMNLLEELTDGEQAKQRYGDENIHDTVLRFIECLQTKASIVVFDNVDAFVDKDSCTFTGTMKSIFDHITNKLDKGLVIFTCRPSVRDHHYSFLEVPVKGLTLAEAKELALRFGIYESKLDNPTLEVIHEYTQGHALWQTLIFSQIRSGRAKGGELATLLSTQSGIVGSELLRSIWAMLASKEQEVIYALSLFTRPHDIHEIARAVNVSPHDGKKTVQALINLNLVIELDVEGEPHYDLHPIIRIKAKDELGARERATLTQRVILVLSKGDWTKVGVIASVCQTYGPEMDRYVECTEIALENGMYNKAINFLSALAEPLRRYGEDAKFIRLARALFDNMDQEKQEIGIHPKLSPLYREFIEALLDQGENAMANSYLSKLGKRAVTPKQYAFFAEVKGNALWFENQFEEAITWIQKSIDLIREQGGTIASDGNIYCNLALSLRDAGRVDEALAIFLSRCSLDELEAWDPDADAADHSADAGNVARCLYLLGKYNESLRLCLKSAKRLMRDHQRGMIKNYGYALLWIADNYVMLNNWDEAESYVRGAYRVWLRYCPTRLKKIAKHVTSYPAELAARLSLDSLEASMR